MTDLERAVRVRMPMDRTSNKQRKTRAVKVGNVIIGGGFPVVVQTMGKQPLEEDPSALLREIDELAALGCGILRFSVPHEQAARRFNLLAESSPIPLAADIHFDYKLALLCLDGRGRRFGSIREILGIPGRSSGWWRRPPTGEFP